MVVYLIIISIFMIYAPLYASFTHLIQLTTYANSYKKKWKQPWVYRHDYCAKNAIDRGFCNFCFGGFGFSNFITIKWQQKIINWNVTFLSFLNIQIKMDRERSDVFSNEKKTSSKNPMRTKRDPEKKERRTTFQPLKKLTLKPYFFWFWLKRF